MRRPVLLFVVLLLLVGCDDFKPAEKPDLDNVTLCSAEVMVCPDGSYVSRDPEHNCDFKPCLETGYGDPTQEWGEGELE
ncbi:hypothetical protein GF367_02285 [Candidatus Woesearchaeota archaeon]|nr:hypothetical protein [Candidatus Woesearchaeota archaeon]